MRSQQCSVFLQDAKELDRLFKRFHLKLGIVNEVKACN